MYQFTRKQEDQLETWLDSMDDLSFSEAKELKQGVRDYMLVREFYGKALIYPAVSMNEEAQREYLRDYARLTNDEYDEPNGCLDLLYENIRYTLIADPDRQEPRVSYFFDIYFNDSTVDNIDIRDIFGEGFDKPAEVC